MWLDEQSSRECYTHPPTTTHVLSRALHHFLAEPKTMQDTPCLCLERVGIQFVEFFIRSIQCELVNVIGNAEIFDALLELSDLLSCGGNDEVDSVDF